MSPPPCLCSLFVRIAVKCGISGVLDAEVNFDSCIVTTLGCVVLLRCLSSSTVLLMPFALNTFHLSVFCFGGLLFVSCVAVCGCGDVKSWDECCWGEFV